MATLGTFGKIHIIKLGLLLAIKSCDKLKFNALFQIVNDHLPIKND